MSWPAHDRPRRPVEAAERPPRRTGPLLRTPSISPFRWGALLASVIVASPRLAEADWGIWAGIAAPLLYAAFRSARPIRYDAGRTTTVALWLDALIHTEVVLLTGAWDSPFVFTLIPPVLQAGFARGSGHAARMAGVIVLLVSGPHMMVTQELREGVLGAAAWFAILLVVAVLSGFAQQVSSESVRQQTITLDRLHKLSEANALLFQLHRVTQSLPASLDLDELLDASVARIGELLSYDHLTVLLYEESTRTWVPVRTRGNWQRQPIPTLQLPPPLVRARMSLKVVAEPDLGPPRSGLAQGTRSGLYAALQARGALVGLVALESGEPHRFGTREIELLSGIIEPLGIAIDNARWFGRLRAIGAEEERSRIARDLHDQIGQSLASLAFGLDHLKRTLSRGGDASLEVDELSAQLRGTIREVREALYDLRTGVSDTTDLPSAMSVFLDRVSNRSGLQVSLRSDGAGRLPLPVEREVWWIAREAVANVERHADADHCDVSWTVTPTAAELTVADDGVGFAAGAGRIDSYGILGMRERASTIGAQLDITSAPGQGTTVRVVVRRDGGPV